MTENAAILGGTMSGFVAKPLGIGGQGNTVAFDRKARAP
jgi:hypothetical protein